MADVSHRLEVPPDWEGSRGSDATTTSTPSDVVSPPSGGDSETELVEKKTSPRELYGRIVGGKFASQDEKEDYGRAEGEEETRVVPLDLPLTLTHHTFRAEEAAADNGVDAVFTDEAFSSREHIILHFAPGDLENPFNWSRTRKLFATILLSLMTCFIGLAATAYASGLVDMIAELHTSLEIGEIGLFLFNIGCAFPPMFLAPFCELTGRRYIYIISFLCFALVAIGLALGRNIATILVMRALQGLFGASGIILVGGTFTDMYEPAELAGAMSLFAYMAILGTVSAPIYAGFVDQAIGWRWLEGIQGLANIPLLVLVIFFLPETRGGVVLSRRAKALRKATGDLRYVAPMDLEAPTVGAMLHQSCVKAVHMLVSEPVVFAFGAWIAFAWCLTFLFLSVVPITFIQGRGWSEGVGGLPYISLSVGTTIGYALQTLQTRHYASLLRASDHPASIAPESRLWLAKYTSLLLPTGLFIYSFTQYSFLDWPGAVIALAPIAAGIYAVFEATYSYTADCYAADSSSAIAGQGLLRNIAGAVVPLFARQFFENVGSQYAGLILAIVACILGLVPWVMVRWGAELRRRSRLARTFEGAEH